MPIGALLAKSNENCFRSLAELERKRQWHFHHADSTFLNSFIA
jgi:hypothetical protein